MSAPRPSPRSFPAWSGVVTRENKNKRAETAFSGAKGVLVHHLCKRLGNDTVRGGSELEIPSRRETDLWFTEACRMPHSAKTPFRAHIVEH